MPTKFSMARGFAKVSEEEVVPINETAFFYPCDLVNTTLRVSVYIHHYSPSIRGIVVYYTTVIYLVLQ